MSIIDNFMSKVIDLDEKEKEEVILFLAEALLCVNPSVVKNVSIKVSVIVLPFLTDVAVSHLEKIKKKGGEKVGTGTRLKND